MTLRIGLLAASRIAEGAVVEPARRVDGVEVVAVAARDGARARDAAERWGIPTAHDSYEALLSDPTVDAVYVSTPTALHRPWVLAALAAGKHVLVEKPLASNATDAETIVAAAQHASSRELVTMEAFHSAHHPLRSSIDEVLRSGVLGAVEQVHASFAVASVHIPRDDIRWDLALGGGAMMDIGTYAVGFVLWVRDELPEVLTAAASCPVPEVDGQLLATLRWPDGVTGSVHGSMVRDGESGGAWLEVIGSEGRMVVVNPVAPQLGSSLTVETSGDVVEVAVPRDSTYDHQLRGFRDAVIGGAPVRTGVVDASRRMQLIDACYLGAGLVARPTWRG